MNQFFALMNRMKYIDRWGLMNCARKENVMEHSAMTAMFAHALAMAENQLAGGNYDPGRAALLGLYHEAAEVLTGDLPTPVKYYNGKITGAYREIEREAESRIAEQVPDCMRGGMAGLISQDKTERESVLVKAADKLAALVKCREERAAGAGREFDGAYEATLTGLKAMNLKSVEFFLSEIIPTFDLSLDECFK